MCVHIREYASEVRRVVKMIINLNCDGIIQGRLAKKVGSVYNSFDPIMNP
jgi:hypothetical protein